MRSSPSKGVSRCPLKKKVTWAYFSVSAMRSCRLFARAMIDPQMLGMFCERVSGGYAMPVTGTSASYRVRVVKCTLGQIWR